MRRTIGRLGALQVSRAMKPGMHPDGAGLYLLVGTAGTKSWIFRYQHQGRERQMGLGSLSAVSLADARRKAAECRAQRAEGIDPIQARDAARGTAKAATTFTECAKAYIASHRAGWRNARHAKQWPSTLETYAYPIFGDLPVSAIDTALVLKVLSPMWATKPETASRVRGRIELVLDAAKAQGLRSGENPARWKGHLANLLPGKHKVRRVQHHPALPYAELPAFMAKLRSREAMSARALEFLILTAARTDEVVSAKWVEIDHKAKLWIVPADRIKGAREHRVPLEIPALKILERVRAAGGLFIFPGIAGAMSRGTIAGLLSRMRPDVTVHGFRSTFREWAAECTAFPREVAEMALAHVIGDETEQAYQRGDLLEKRRRLMAAWATYCGKVPAKDNVVDLPVAVASTR